MSTPSPFPANPDADTTPATPSMAAPFRQYLSDRLELLDGSTAGLDENVDIIRLWPQRKKKLLLRLLEPMSRMLAALKKTLLPPRNIKRYNREKKRLLRAKYPLIYSWQGFNLKGGLGFLWVLNLLRILLILSIAGGGAFLIVYMIAKLFHLIKI